MPKGILHNSPIQPLLEPLIAHERESEFLLIISMFYEFLSVKFL